MMTIEGIEVIDARSDLTFYISDEHINKAGPFNKGPLWIEHCPGSQACLDIPGTKRAQLYKSRLFILKDIIDDEGEKSLKWERYTVPKTLMIQEAIIDNGGKFNSGYYTVKAPTKSKKTGKQQGSDTRPKDKGKPRTKPHQTPMRENAPNRST